MLSQVNFSVYACLHPDINECEDDHGCSQVCINKIGSFHCECNSGFILLADGKQCRGNAIDFKV